VTAERVAVRLTGEGWEPIGYRGRIMPAVPAADHRRVSGLPTYDLRIPITGGEGSSLYYGVDDPAGLWAVEVLEAGTYGIIQVDPATTPRLLTCAVCARSWAEDITPAGRCPWEHMHDDDEPDDEPATLTPGQIAADVMRRWNLERPQGMPAGQLADMLAEAARIARGEVSA
jgi:hypothetical protein